MKRIVLLFAILFACVQLRAQDVSPKHTYRPILSDHYVQSKNYYLLTLLAGVPELNSAIKTDQVLLQIMRNKRERIAGAVKDCKHDLGCYIDAVKFAPNEITAVADRLRALYQSSKVVRDIINTHLLPSGYYQLYTSADPQDLLIKSWEQDAAAINYCIDVYAAGKKPAYAQIDSISYNIKDPAYSDMVALNESLALSETQSDPLFFNASMVFALHSLEINEREQAADFEPMESGVNKAALAYAKHLDWDKFSYTLILVPGEGPEEPATALSGGGMLRCRLAALQYRAGIAPLIMVSGGCVHPYKTKYNEAQEMKNFLVNVLHIPEYAILMEPHARHTTTNLRNCSRLIFKYGFPMEKPCITVTSRSQSAYITSVMAARCQKELGYVPYKNGKRLSDTAAEFFPLTNAMQIDADEPMDP